MDTPNEKTNAFEIFKNYLPIITVGGALFVNVVLTWKNVSDNQISIKELRDQVLRQYTTQREMNDKTNKEVDVLKLEASYLRGYSQALKDLKTVK